MRFIDRLFMGRIIKDFGLLCEKPLPLGTRKIRVFLAERGGVVKLVFKSSAWSLTRAGVSYFEVPAEAVPKLAQWLAEAEGIMGPPVRPEGE